MPEILTGTNQRGTKYQLTYKPESKIDQRLSIFGERMALTAQISLSCASIEATIDVYTSIAFAHIFTTDEDFVSALNREQGLIPFFNRSTKVNEINFGDDLDEFRNAIEILHKLNPIPAEIQIELIKLFKDIPRSRLRDSGDDDSGSKRMRRI